MLNFEQSVKQPTCEYVQDSVCQQMLRGYIALPLLVRQACLRACLHACLLTSRPHTTHDPLVQHM